MDRIFRILLVTAAFTLSVAAAARADVTQQTVVESIAAGEPDRGPSE